jgi:hypothetical protein
VVYDVVCVAQALPGLLNVCHTINHKQRGCRSPHSLQVDQETYGHAISELIPACEVLWLFGKLSRFKEVECAVRRQVTV